MVNGLNSARERRALAAEEARALIAHLGLILDELAFDGNRPPRSASALIRRLRKMYLDGAHHVCERACHMVQGVQQGVVNSPMKAVGIAFATGALVAFFFARNSRRSE
ncbi:hypothetical protein [Cupriavidus lacunae]|uniref:DUF883 domain-containing protein n=1 Tax=Cupriavidus lacunae TaxID=2666307 RepID=A0A370NJE1_9BURK|nr:hypothetical protein [Cupriavidus lacunae]RDK05705.1 hypothetical protein DN412_35595 [Cupriavidus lacunae]